MLADELAPNDRVATLNGVATPSGAVVLATTHQVNDAIRRLAGEVKQLVEANPESPLLLVVLLQGGRFFADRLSEELRGLTSAHFERLDLKVSTRDELGRLLPNPSIQGDVGRTEGRRVLVADDILDSGLTLSIIREELSGRASELKTAVLVQKDNPDVSVTELQDRPKADYVGLHFIDKRWYSGAGMDMPNDPEGRARLASLIIAYPPLA